VLVETTSINMKQKIMPDKQLPELLALADPFQVAEQIAQFILDEAQGWDHIPQVHTALVELARKIRTADWIKP
jgi:hypothetical protein